MKKNEINLKFFDNGNSGMDTSEETVYCIGPIIPLNNNFFSVSDVSLDSSPESTEKKLFYSLYHHFLK